MPLETADLIYREVLTATYRDACTVEGDPALIRKCSCQYGRCGHCGAGRHTSCTTSRVGPIVGPETYITSRSGRARTPVLLSGRPCRWVCVCNCPPPEPETQPTLFDPGPARAKRHGQPDTRRHRELHGQLDLFDLAGGAA